MTEAVAWLSAWYNVPYLFALAVTVVFSTFQIVFGFLPDAIDIDLGDGDIDVDVDTDVGGDAGHELAVDGGHGVIGSVLSFLGVGKAPSTILGLALLFSVGTLGLVANAAVTMTAGAATLSTGLFVGMGAANLFVGGLFTGRLALALNWLLPSHDTTTSDGTKVLGTQGKAASRITEKGGQVRIGPNRWIDAVTASGSQPIEKGAEVLLITYDKSLFRYIVEEI